MIEVSIVIEKGGETFIGLNVMMPQVPRIGDTVALDAVLSEPTTDQAEVDYREKYEGSWNCEVVKVTWRIGHSLNKGDEDSSFQNVLVTCELTE